MTSASPFTVLRNSDQLALSREVEVYFSVVQRKVVPPDDFTDLNEVTDRLRAFEECYNATAQPFQWRFTTSDLGDLPAGLDRHTTDQPEESSAAPTA